MCFVVCNSRTIMFFYFNDKLSQFSTEHFVIVFFIREHENFLYLFSEILAVDESFCSFFFAIFNGSRIFFLGTRKYKPKKRIYQSTQSFARCFWFDNFLYGFFVRQQRISAIFYEFGIISIIDDIVYVFQHNSSENRKYTVYLQNLLRKAKKLGILYYTMA